MTSRRTQPEMYLPSSTAQETRLQRPTLFPPRRPPIGLALLALLAGSIAAVPAFAQQGAIPGYPDNVQAYDPREVAMLPPYCMYTQDFRGRVPGGNNSEQIARWKAVLGETYEHLHHYCWGLMKTNRGLLLARGQQMRNAYLFDAISEFDYVLQHLPADYFLLPEILTRKGENLIRVGKGPTGLLHLEQAIDAKPDYWPPYAQISDYYKDLGDTAKAREALERGLAKVPDTPALKRRMAELQQGRHAPQKATPAATSTQ